MNALQEIITKLGPGAIAKACGGNISYEAVRRWKVRGRLPRTEFTGETRYAEMIAAIESCEFSSDQLKSAGYEQASSKENAGQSLFSTSGKPPVEAA